MQVSARVPGSALYGCLLFLVWCLGNQERKSFGKKAYTPEGNLLAGSLACPSRGHGELLPRLERPLNKFMCWKVNLQVHLLMVTGGEACGRQSELDEVARVRWWLVPLSDKEKSKPAFSPPC